MRRRKPAPGAAREERLSEQGLQRLERQLRAGTISRLVLQQWLRRYGDAAQKLIDQYRPADREDGD